MARSADKTAALSRTYPPFPVAPGRFDQKHEMFKRVAWDEDFAHLGRRFYADIVYKDKVGYRQIDYAFRNAAWNLEWQWGFGNSRSNSGLYSWEGVPAKMQCYLDQAERLPLQAGEATALVKRVARFLGADLVGVCRVYPGWVYSHEFDLVERTHRRLELPKGCRNAVVMAVEMDYEALRSSPTGVGGAGTGLGYSRMAFVAGLLAVFIRGLGYRAVPSGNDTALSVPLALAAGLGEVGRHGLLITEEYGPRVRLCKVFTDLPLKCDEYRPFGVEEFCRECKQCAAHCPSRALSFMEKTLEGPSICNHSGIPKWYIDAEKCFSFWAQNRLDCANCIRACPFNKKPGLHHAAVRAVVRRTGAFNGLFTAADRMLGYEDQVPAAHFWEGGARGRGRTPRGHASPGVKPA